MLNILHHIRALIELVDILLRLQRCSTQRHCDIMIPVSSKFHSRAYRSSEAGQRGLHRRVELLS